MGMSVKEIVSEALALPAATRAYLAEKLLQSLDYEEDFVVSAEWLDEARRRALEINDGIVQTIPAEQVFAELRNQLQ